MATTTTIQVKSTWIPTEADFLSSNVPATGEPNPNEKRPGTDQFSLSLERELAQNFAVRLTGVYIRTFNENRFLNVKRPPETYNVPVTNADPGPDNRLWHQRRSWNLPHVLGISRRVLPAKRMSTSSSATTRRLGRSTRHSMFNWSSGFRTGGNCWQGTRSPRTTPSSCSRPTLRGTFLSGIPTSRSMRAITQVEHVAKLSGHVTLPGEVSMSANYNYQSGPPQARQVLVAGGRADSEHGDQCGAAWQFLSPGHKRCGCSVPEDLLTQRAPCVASREFLQRAELESSSPRGTCASGATYLKPSAILPPRIVEFGVGITF